MVSLVLLCSKPSSTNTSDNVATINPSAVDHAWVNERIRTSSGRHQNSSSKIRRAREHRSQSRISVANSPRPWLWPALSCARLGMFPVLCNLASRILWDVPIALVSSPSLLSSPSLRHELKCPVTPPLGTEICVAGSMCPHFSLPPGKPDAPDVSRTPFLHPSRLQGIFSCIPFPFSDTLGREG
ncbi:hypothetical protein BD309DRAFT_966219 [Dichomitus squalens]|nr:hypothetical protein BD309DRAFT_966219 [Dichomitus squalens]